MKYILEGGPGSGHHGHKGRKGKRGGARPSGIAALRKHGIPKLIAFKGEKIPAGVKAVAKQLAKLPFIKGIGIDATGSEVYISASSKVRSTETGRWPYVSLGLSDSHPGNMSGVDIIYDTDFDEVNIELMSSAPRGKGRGNKMMRAIVRAASNVGGMVTVAAPIKASYGFWRKMQRRYRKDVLKFTVGLPM